MTHHDRPKTGKIHRHGTTARQLSDIEAELVIRRRLGWDGSTEAGHDPDHTPHWRINLWWLLNPVPLCVMGTGATLIWAAARWLG